MPINTFEVRSINFATSPGHSHAAIDGVLLERYPPEHRLHPKFAELRLSRREKEIAALVVQGHSNREIAERSFNCEQMARTIFMRSSKSSKYEAGAS